MAVFAASQALDMAVKLEENGEAFYRAAAETRSENELQELFEDLAGRERSHRQVFERMAAEVEEAPEPPPAEVGDYASFLEVALNHAVFSGPDKALSIAEEAEDRTAVLRAAMGFEKDTLLFYYDLREMVGEKDRDVVSDIIREEKQHLQRLAKQV
ncbi:MAG: ferritin-like domain-containing protein [Chloroflexota bacterium]